MTKRALITLAWAALLFLAAASRSAATESIQTDPRILQSNVDLYASTTTYTITRKGKPIGTHEVKFSRAGNELTVDVKSSIKVTVLTVPVFRFDYRAIEIWRDGKLVSVTSETQENDKNTQVGMSSNQTQTNLANPDGSKTVERIFYTSNHWNSAVLNATTVFNTLTGKASEVEIKLVNDQAQVNQTSARQYRYAGDIKADVWYDTNGKWLKLAFKGDDGSLIEYTIDE